MDLNVNNLSVDSNGRVSFSGLGSNIDFQGVVDSIIAAKRIPIDRLETEVSSNESKIAALGDLRTLLTDVKDSLSTLHGAVSFGNANDTFEKKEAFASSSRTDGGVASNAANLIGVTVTNSAPVGGHTLEVLQTAKAHKIASDAVASTTTALGFAGGDTFTFATTDADGNPDTVDITVSGTTTLLGLRDLINNANQGSTATGVSASIVSVSSTEHYLVLSNEQTGSDIAVTETAGTPLQTIGLFDAGSGFKNELQTAQTAQMYADGILDQTNTIYETAYQSATTATPTTGGTLEFFDGVGASIGTVDYLATDDLNALAGKINVAALGVTASVVSDGSGFRMEISGGSAFTIAEAAAGTALTDLGVDNKRRVIERDSNTVDDLFAGVTVSLFQAEVGTTINLDIERNLNEIKTSVSTFVDAYNELRRFINDQRTLVEEQEDDEETVTSGLLFSSEALEQADSQLSSIIGAGVAGVSSNYSVLAQIGVDFIPLGSEADPLDANTLEIDEAVLDSALLNNVEDIRRLFSFDFTSSDPRVTLLNFDSNTEYSAAGLTLNIQPNSGTNLAQYSDEFDNAYWNAVRSSVAADDTIGPSGQTTADGLVGDATNNTHLLTNTSPFAVTAGDTYTYSVYAKKGTPTGNDSTRIQLAGVQFPTDSFIDVNLDTGTVFNEGLGLDGYDVQDAGNGWYRISVTATAAATGNATAEMYSMDGINTVYTGDGSTVDTYFSGAQFEPAAINSTHVDSFTTINSTTSAATVDDPYNVGNFGATSIIANAVNTDHGITNGSTASVTSGETYEFSAYLQAGDRSRARLSLNTGFGAGTQVDVRLDTGTILTTGAGADSATIEDAGNGWYKVTLTATATSSETTTSMEIRAVDAVSGLGFAGDGVTASTHVYDMKMVSASAGTPGDYVATTNTAEIGLMASANIGGDASGIGDGTATISGNVITIDTGNGEGMELFFDGLSGPTTIDLSYTVGVGAQMFFAIEDMLDQSTGTVETEIEGLTDTNEISEARITEMLSRLEIQRRSLLERFIAMETALATNQRILESVQASAEALSASNG